MRIKRNETLRLVKIEVFVGGEMYTVFTEVGRDLIGIVSSLERDPIVREYHVFDITTMTRVAPYQYGYGDCPKWAVSQRKVDNV